MSYLKSLGILMFLFTITCSCSRQAAKRDKAAVDASAAKEESQPAENIQPQRPFADITVNDQLTRDGVAAIWGPPDFKPGAQFHYTAYVLEKGQELWFVFAKEPPGRLERAILVASNGAKTTLFPKSEAVPKK